MVASATAPAASVGPSSPSVPPLSTTTFRIPSGPSFASIASTNSWFRPPFPVALPSETVVSPPIRMHAGGASGWPRSRMFRTMPAAAVATSRVSPSTNGPRSSTR